MSFSLPAVSFVEPAWLWLLLLALPVLMLGWPGPLAPDRRRQGWALALRLVILLALVLGLAGAQLERPEDTLTTVFVLDVSDSISADDRARAEAFLRAALAEKPAADRAAVVMFGGDALVEQLPRSEAGAPALASLPVKSATDIERGLRLALALLPGQGGSRIVLLSDGRETEGEARRLLDLAAARQVEISVYPLGDRPPGETGRPEVLVKAVTAPGQARQGQSIPVEVVVTASRPVQASLHLLADGRPAADRPVRLVEGDNRFQFSLPAGQPGFRRFRVEVEPAADGRPENNWGGAFTTVYGPPRVLLVAGQPAEVANLAAALAAAGLQPAVVEPAALPGDLAGLAAYEAIILANVPASALPEPLQANLAGFVRDLGRGLVMVGGPQSYGAGGYLRSPLEKALPVDMAVRSRSREPNIALVLAVDKSGSMGACHCDNPDLRQTYSRVPSGLPKVDIAKEAIFQAAQVVGDLDYMGVVAFDSSAHWQLELGPWVGPGPLEQAIGGMGANGQTNIYAGLAAAEEALQAAPARLKHIILLTDGWSLAGAYDELTTRLAAEGITLSVVAAGNGSAEYLADLARRGGGQYYPAPSIGEVPQIFLKETVRAAGSYIIEEPFRPVVPLPVGPLLRGIALDSAPPLLGYNGATAKAAARVTLLTPRGDPLLATWQYGLGRAAAWTSDLGGRWAQAWLAWPEFPRLAAQIVTWSLPAPADERLDLAISTGGGRASLTADLRDDAGRPQSFLTLTGRLLGPDGQALDLDLAPVGAGRYRSAAPLPIEGVYLVQVTAYSPAPGGLEPVASRTAGLVAPYSPEYASLAGDPTLLADLAAATGGQRLAEPAQAFAHNLAPGRQTQPLWPALLLLAALLFPVDVAVRRLRLDRRDWQRLVRYRPARWHTARPALSSEPAPFTVQALRQARQRVRQRSIPRPPAIPPAAPSPAPPAAGPPPEQPGTPSSAPIQEEEAGDTLARLRAAKKRARR